MQLLFLNYLLELDKGDDVQWPEYVERYKYIYNVVEHGLKSSNQYPVIKSIYSRLKDYINIIRRCIAHSDYKIEESKGELTIIFPNDEEKSLTFDDLCGIMSMTFDLIRILHIAIHLCIYRKNKLILK